MITSVASRTYLSKVQQTFRDLINYLEIQHTKPEKKTYKESCSIRFASYANGLMLVFLEKNPTVSCSAQSLISFHEKSQTVCQELLDALESEQRPFQSLSGKRMSLDTNAAKLFCTGIKNYAEMLQREISDQHTDTGMVITIHPTAQESEATERKASFKKDI